MCLKYLGAYYCSLLAGDITFLYHFGLSHCPPPPPFPTEGLGKAVRWLRQSWLIFCSQSIHLLALCEGKCFALCRKAAERKMFHEAPNSWVNGFLFLLINPSHTHGHATPLFTVEASPGCFHGHLGWEELGGGGVRGEGRSTRAAGKSGPLQSSRSSHAWHGAWNAGGWGPSLGLAGGLRARFHASWKCAGQGFSAAGWWWWWWWWWWRGATRSNTAWAGLIDAVSSFFGSRGYRGAGGERSLGPRVHCGGEGREGGEEQ